MGINCVLEGEGEMSSEQTNNSFSFAETGQNQVIIYTYWSQLAIVAKKLTLFRGDAWK